MEHAKKTFLEKHAAAMVCHRQEFADSNEWPGPAFDALADYADDLAAKVAEAEQLLANVSLLLGGYGPSGLPGGIAAR